MTEQNTNPPAPTPKPPAAPPPPAAVRPAPAAQPPVPKPDARGDSQVETPATPFAGPTIDLSGVTSKLDEVVSAVKTQGQPGEASEETLVEIPWSTIIALLGIAVAAVVIYKFSPQIRDFVRQRIAQAQSSLPEQTEPVVEMESEEE